MGIVVGSRRRGTGSAPVLKAGLGLALAVSTMAVVVTGAVFTDATTVAGNTFSTGDVEISPSVTTDLVSFTSPAMVPGDAVVDGVTVTNAGSVEMRYAVRSSTTEDLLASQLDLVVWDEAEEADGAGANATCDSTPPATTLYAAGDLGSVGGVNLVGDTSQGGHTGDRILAAAASEVLCFEVSLPVATNSSYENLTTTATFTFAAEQTANNA